MHNTILTIMLLLGVTISAQAQFNTISAKGHAGREIKSSGISIIYNKVSDMKIGASDEDSIAEPDTIAPTDASAPSDQKRNVRKYEEKQVREVPEPTVSKRDSEKARKNLPELTIPNLLAEIERNGIRFPKIVLAQAILETGWFRSSVCRNKHNLFGLTNPRTKTYYEFSHWTESVRAYYTKVQYRYKGGNYLLWLRNIGYAEDPGYIRAVIRVLKQL